MLMDLQQQDIDLAMGVYLSEPNTEKHYQSQQGTHYSYVSAEMQGWRKTMEDACIHNLDLNDGNALFGVFDGHGGSEVSKYVSTIFERQLKNSQAYKQKDYKKALTETFRRVDEIMESAEGQRELYIIRYGENSAKSQISEGNREFIGSAVGCTANVVLITPTSYFAANAGDSRSVLSRQGKAFDLSKDHKPDSPVEESRIKKAGGQIVMGRVNGGLNLTRSFADFDYKKNKNLPYDEQMITCHPDVEQFPITPQDEFIVMGCDGIWEKYVENSQGLIEIVGRDIQGGKEPKKIVQDLLNGLLATNTNSGIGCDNMTVILILIKH